MHLFRGNLPGNGHHKIKNFEWGIFLLKQAPGGYCSELATFILSVFLELLHFVKIIIWMTTELRPYAEPWATCLCISFIVQNQKLHLQNLSCYFSQLICGKKKKKRKRKILNIFSQEIFCFGCPFNRKRKFASSDTVERFIQSCSKGWGMERCDPWIVTTVQTEQ